MNLTTLSAAQLHAIHFTEHRKLFPNSNPVQVEGCCCAVGFAYRTVSQGVHSASIFPERLTEHALYLLLFDVRECERLARLIPCMIHARNKAEASHAYDAAVICYHNTQSL